MPLVSLSNTLKTSEKCFFRGYRKRRVIWIGWLQFTKMFLKQTQNGYFRSRQPVTIFSNLVQRNIIGDILISSVFTLVPMKQIKPRNQSFVHFSSTAIDGIKQNPGLITTNQNLKLWNITNNLKSYNIENVIKSCFIYKKGF